MEKIEDATFICHGCLKKCELIVKNQNIYFEEACALDNLNKWERKQKE